MAQLNYVGGKDPEIVAAKAENLKLANEIARTRLLAIRKDLLDRRQVRFVVQNALVVLRDNLLRLPGILAGNLRGLEPGVAHGIRQEIERRVRVFLHETTEALQKSVDPESVIADLESDGQQDPEVVQREADAAALERNRANAKRREKRKAKQGG